MTEPKLNPEPNAPPDTPKSPTRGWKGPLFAVLLSLLIPGLGQLKNRQPWKGLLIAVTSALFTMLAYYGRLLSSFKGLVISLTLGLLWLALICIDAFRAARHGRDDRTSFQQARATFLVCGVLIVMLLLIDSVAYHLHKLGYYQAFKTTSASMCPTICEGDRIIADMDAFLKSGPHRGDVILMKHAVSEALFIKRVIAVEGDVVSVKPGEILVNGQHLVEPQHADGCGGASMNPPPYDAMMVYAETKVPSSSFFVVGDNLANSNDTRVQGFGFVQPSQLRGRPLYIYWSPNSSRIGCPIQ
jgi:signal peptidase I